MLVSLCIVTFEACASGCLAFPTQVNLFFFFAIGFRFTISGRVVGAVGGESCPLKEGGPSNVNVELLTPAGDLVSSVLTSSDGSYLFTNIIPGTKVSKFL